AWRGGNAGSHRELRSKPGGNRIPTIPYGGAGLSVWIQRFLYVSRLRTVFGRASAGSDGLGGVCRYENLAMLGRRSSVSTCELLVHLLQTLHDGTGGSLGIGAILGGRVVPSFS